MSTTPAVVAYVVASLGCSVLTGTFMAAHLPPVLQQPAVQGTLDRVGTAFAARAVDAFSEAQPEPSYSDARCGPQSWSCDASISEATAVCRAEVRTRDSELAEARRAAYFWQTSTYIGIVIGTGSYIWLAMAARGRRMLHAEQVRISNELSDIASAISPARARISPRRLSGGSVVDLRRLERYGELADAGEDEDSGSDSDPGPRFDPLPWPEDVA